LAGLPAHFPSAEKREDAIKILIAGGIVALVGLGISYSAEKKE